MDEVQRTVEPVESNWWEQAIRNEWIAMRIEITDFHELTSAQQIILQQMFVDGMMAGRAVTLERIAEIA